MQGDRIGQEQFVLARIMAAEGGVGDVRKLHAEPGLVVELIGQRAADTELRDLAEIFAAAA